MSDIKSVIILLCKTLNLMFEVRVKPEHFRQAKFDKTEEDAVPLFWDLLYKISTKTDYNKIQTVKLYFASLNYKNVYFYCLPEDMSHGSRELLLALAWLLSKHNILDKFLRDELHKSKISQEFHLDNVCVPKEDYSVETLNTIQDHMNYIIWLFGRIHTNKKLTMEYDKKTLDLAAKLHKMSKENYSVTLSVSEACYLKDEKELSRYLHEIERAAHLLDYVTRWRDKEKSFWDWMMSVMKEKSATPKSSIDSHHLDTFFKLLKGHLKNLLKTDIVPAELDIFNESNFPKCILSEKPVDNKVLKRMTNNINMDDIKSEQTSNIIEINEFLINFMDQ